MSNDAGGGVTLAQWAIHWLDHTWPPGATLPLDHACGRCLGGAVMSLLPVELHSAALRADLETIAEEWLVLRLAHPDPPQHRPTRHRKEHR